MTATLVPWRRSAAAVRGSRPAGTGLDGWALALLAALCLWPASAYAHIKWLKPFDITEPPRPIGEVLDQTFLAFFLGSVVFVYLFFVADRYAYKKGILVEFDKRLSMFDGLSITIMRAAAGVFFAAIWAHGYFTGHVFLLTPELVAGSSWVLWVQLATALCALTRLTTPLIAVGIVVLFAAALHSYGVYHLIDYLLFLGIAYFFAATSSTGRGWKKSGFVVLYASTGINFLWLSVEKFAYPEWTYPLLAENPDMLMGMAPAVYMILAGFIEFVIVFVMLGAASVATRIVALGLLGLFVIAVFKFGLFDALGHLMIMAIFFVLIVRGPTDARGILVLATKSPQMEAYFMTGLYYLAFVNAFLLYYGLHYLFYAR